MSDYDDTEYWYFPEDKFANSSDEVPDSTGLDLDKFVEGVHDHEDDILVIGDTMRTRDANGIPERVYGYTRVDCEHCGEFFDHRHPLDSPGRMPKYCSPVCKSGADKSRKSEEQRQINEYIARNPVRKW